MMVVDSSALMAIAQDEEAADRCADCLKRSDETLISAVTLAELLVVAQSRGVANHIRALIENLNVGIVPADETTAQQVAFTYRTFGKGNHPAKLNLVDCFSYAVAKSQDCPLLYIGNDFSQTDIESAL